MEASLVTRLAGPSAGKAGLANDQTEINRIIAESSKGSKFFENEKRKDKELTEKIEKLLKHRDEVLRGVDIARLEANIEKTLVGLEAQRDLTQYIVHVDMDAFFAAVELLDDPNLKGKPFGVGKGVLTTASYEARSYGARSGMPGFIAKKLCPQLILLPIRGARYSEMSSKVMAVFQRYDTHMMAAGTDEAYLNITQYCGAHAVSPDECVQRLRAEVHAETGLTVSAGIAPNKMLAKVCSDKNKPNGQFHLPFARDDIVAFLRELPIRKIPGIGRVTERLLDSIGIKTCGDIYTHRVTLSLLDKQFHTRSLLLTYLGIASNVVQPGQREERKSVGSERTFRPTSDEGRIIAKLENCALDLEEDMERTGWAGATVTLKYKLDTYQTFTRAKSSTRYINRKEDLFAIGKGLLLPELPLTIRLIGLRVTKLKDLRAADDQGLKRFFEPAGGSPSKKRQKLDYAIEEDPESDVFEEKTAMDTYEDDIVEAIIVDDNDSGGLVGSDADIPSTKLDPKHVSHPRPPSNLAKTSTVGRSARKSSCSASTLKPKSDTSASPNSKSRPIDLPLATEEQTCPICSKAFETDNAGLNEHVDFCLSKTAILAATAATTEPSSVNKKKRSDMG